MQSFFREWDALDQQEWYPRFIDVLDVDIMRRFHYGLQDDLSGDALLARFSQNLRLIESLAAAIFHEAAQILADAPNRPINPYAITLNSHVWEKEGLFDPGKVVEVEEVAAATMKKIRLTPVASARPTKELQYVG